jgi:hypothetical protein
MACSPPDHRHVQRYRWRDREEFLPHGRRYAIQHAPGSSLENMGQIADHGTPLSDSGPSPAFP